MKKAIQKKIDLLSSQAKTAEQNMEYMNAAHLYRKAINELRGKPNSDKYITNFTAKLVEMNILCTQNEMSEIKFSIPINENDILSSNKFIKKWENSKTNDILKCIGKSKKFIPNTKKIKELSEKSMPIAFQIASINSTDDKGNTLKGSSQPEKLWYNINYNIKQNIIIDLYLIPLIEKLDENKKFTTKTIIKFLDRNNIVSDTNKFIIKHALDRFFAKDYVSALHVLIPRFESFFLDISKHLGIKTIKINNEKNISTETITFSERHLESSNFTEIWGEDFCEQIKFINFSTLGFKLRHLIAHGEIDLKELNYRNCILIIYLFIATSSK